MKRTAITLFLAFATLFTTTAAFANAGGQGGANGQVWHKGDNPANPDQGVKPL